MNKVRVGVIGLGAGKTHLKFFRECPKAEIVAVCDSDEEVLRKVGQEYDVPSLFRDYRSMLDMEDLDAVSIATPNVYHAPMSIEALNKGKHVLCEKPMALNAREAREMVEHAGRNRKKLMVHFNQRYSPGARYIKNYVDSGNLGEIYYVKTSWLRQMGAPGRPSFTDRSVSGGGPLIDLGVHRLDFVLWLLGYPKALAVSAGVFDKIAGHRVRKKGMKYDVEDLGVALVRLENGCVLFLEVSWAAMMSNVEEIDTVVFGDRGGFEQKSRNRNGSGVSELKLIKEMKDKIVEITPKIPQQKGTAQEHFVDCILKDVQPEVSGEHGLEIMKILDAVYESSKVGAEIKIK